MIMNLEIENEIRIDSFKFLMIPQGEEEGERRRGRIKEKGGVGW